MKKKLKMILAPLLLVTLVGCGSKPTSTGGGGSTTPTPTTPGPITSVTPDTSTTPPDTSTTPPPTTSTSPTPTTPPDTTVIPPDYDNYYNPEYSGYHVPKNVVNMHASYASAAADTETGFAGKIVGFQQYNLTSATVFFANGTYGFRANNVPIEGLAIGQEYVVTGQKGGSKQYYCIDHKKGGMTLSALKDGTISVADVDLSNSSKANEGSLLSFKDALITKIIEDKDYPGIEVLYKTKQYSLTFPKIVLAAEDLTALLNAATVGHSISGKVALTDLAKNQYTLLSASDLSVGGITHLDKRLNLDATNDNLTSSINDNTVTFGKEGEILPLNSDNRNVASLSLLLSQEVENWTDIASIKLDGGTSLSLPTGQNSLPIALDFTEVDAHTIAIDYSIPYYKDYTITVNLGEGLVKEQPTAALIGVVSVNDANSDLTLSEDGTKIESGEIKFFSESAIQASSIKGYSSRGYYVVLNVAAPVGYVAEEATIKRGDEVDSTPLSQYTSLEGNIIVIPYYIPKDTVSPTIDISIHWKTGVLAQQISLSIAEEVTYATWQDAVVADGVIAPDQNSDIDGQPTGSIDAANPIKTSIDETKKVITFGDVGQQIAYYEEDRNLGRAAGNRVGVTITAPTNAGNITNATVDIYLGGDLYKENLKWTESVETDGKLYWYPKITKDMLSTTEDTVVSTVSINWGVDVATDVYTIKVAAGTTLQAAPSQDPVELTTLVGRKDNNTALPEDWTVVNSGKTYGVGVTELGGLRGIRIGTANAVGSIQYNLPESQSINKVIVTLSAAQYGEPGTLNIEVGDGSASVQGTAQATIQNPDSNSSIHGDDKSLLTFEIDTSSLSGPVTYVKIFNVAPVGQMSVARINISIIKA